MTKIGVQNNRYIKGQDEWTDEDFWVYLSPRAELIVNPVYIVEFRKLESVGVIHVGWKDYHGTPNYSNDFVVFKNDDFGRDMYNKFKGNGTKDIATILNNEKYNPILYAPMVIRLHTDVDEKPTIIGMP